MKKLIFAAVATATLAFGTSAFAASCLDKVEMTSKELQQICQTGLQNCEKGDQMACVDALKTCVCDDRQKAMKLMAGEQTSG
ncbi:MAG: hypothetical protein CMM50_08015 [Rhodospirillaceae bacterium]|jgi:hypothetical protein|nr:hypothetical protein [Rhodospirillaceae bacterium]|tara:strand:- start:2539 stop:2784 length:246 start_codon:yes stop_codon:yes gene_type:complete